MSMWQVHGSCGAETTRRAARQQLAKIEFCSDCSTTCFVLTFKVLNKLWENIYKIDIPAIQDTC